jgi:LAS superfamily LD-carboxypeptidase LdcB
MVAAILVLLASPAQAAALSTDGCEIVGTEGDDVLIGTDGDDVICGLGGDDLLLGGEGEDELLGGPGNDQLQGGPGSDLLLGESGRDVLYGGVGDDELRGGDDSDEVVGGPGDDVVRGGNGDDVLAGGTGNDTLLGGNESDVVRGAGGDDVLYGGSGPDIIRGGAGSDRLRGGPDEDVCFDSFARTNVLTCELGNGGDSDPVEIGRATWARLGNDEFVYALLEGTTCLLDGGCDVGSSLPEVVHVAAREASSASGGRALTVSELFGEASTALGEGGRAVFDTSHGLPTLVERGDGTLSEIVEVSFRDDLRRRFVAASLRWENAGFTDYSFTESMSCFCPVDAPLRVTVVAGEIVNTEPPTDDTEIPAASVRTIEGHLAALEALLDGHNIDVAATFDEIYGLPTSYSYDASRAIADEERAISIEDFAPTQSDGPNIHADSVIDEEASRDGQVSDDLLPPLLIVRVGGIEVSSVIADDLQTLIDAAASDGLQLSGGGFRDPQRQIELRKVNCGTSDFAIFEMPAAACSPPTARPGRSQHELGLAIDFTSSGHLITSRSDPALLWLVENATMYGFVNLPAEPWHWSTTGN